MKNRPTKLKRKGNQIARHCAMGTMPIKIKFGSSTEMDADHVTAWSKGGATSVKNCEMLCKTHNRAKGNR